MFNNDRIISFITKNEHKRMSMSLVINTARRELEDNASYHKLHHTTAIMHISFNTITIQHSDIGTENENFNDNIHTYIE